MRLIENISRRLLPRARIKYVEAGRKPRKGGVGREISRNDRAMAGIRSCKSFLVSPYCQPPYQIANRCHIRPWDIARGRAENPLGRDNKVWGSFQLLLRASRRSRLINTGLDGWINTARQFSTYSRLYILITPVRGNIFRIIYNLPGYVSTSRTNIWHLKALVLYSLIVILSTTVTKIIHS